MPPTSVSGGKRSEPRHRRHSVELEEVEAPRPDDRVPHLPVSVGQQVEQGRRAAVGVSGGPAGPADADELRDCAGGHHGAFVLGAVRRQVVKCRAGLRRDAVEAAVPEDIYKQWDRPLVNWQLLEPGLCCDVCDGEARLAQCLHEALAPPEQRHDGLKRARPRDPATGPVALRGVVDDGCDLKHSLVPVPLVARRALRGQQMPRKYAQTVRTVFNKCFAAWIMYRDVVERRRGLYESLNVNLAPWSLF
mmetsp:Transcript_30688/g.73036  ORF Transcript_30688/g.73036 Transcript_30688/m.73036 type:complete len:248 (-) Transcript_30688:1334-2077(-)